MRNFTVPRVFLHWNFPQHSSWIKRPLSLYCGQPSPPTTIYWLTDTFQALSRSILTKFSRYWYPYFTDEETRGLEWWSNLPKIIQLVGGKPELESCISLTPNFYSSNMPYFYPHFCQEPPLYPPWLQGNDPWESKVKGNVGSAAVGRRCNLNSNSDTDLFLGTPTHPQYIQSSQWSIWVLV